MELKPRCIRCRRELRKDGTCQEPKCVRYTSGKKKNAAIQLSKQ